MASTTKPSGLTVTRDGGLKFVTGWKIAAEDYNDGQQFRWRIWKTAKKTTSWTNETIGKASTSKTITVSASSWAPNTKNNIYAFEFQVRGKRAESTDSKGKKTTYDWSDWSGKKWNMAIPNRPTVTTQLTASNQTTFTWTSERDNKDNKPFGQFQYQSFLMKACNETDGSKLKWQSSNRDWVNGYSSTDGSLVRTEDSTLLVGNSWTRWFRIWAKGAAGNSEWRYAKHVYAKPYKPSIKSVRTTTSAGTTNVVMTWTAKSDAAHPIDESIAQYSLAVPGPGLTFPASGASWSNGASVQDTSATDAVNFTINGGPSTDQCLFVRVMVWHDSTSNFTPSGYKIAGYGPLATPTDLDVQVDSSFRATITVTNESDVPDSRVAIVYRNDKGKETTIAVTAAGPGSKTLTNVLVPASTVKAKYYAYAFQGTYETKTRADGGNSIAVDANMISGNVFDTAQAPSVPVPPEDVSVRLSGTDARLSWSWSWESADQAEITWSTNKNAWTSTNPPSSFIIDTKWTNAWRISGTTPGAVWYFRVRLIRTTGEEIVYTPWSEQVSLDRTSAPDAPVVNLSKSVAKPNSNVKATWLYNCEDGIAQGAAEVWRVSNVVDGVPGSFDALISKATTKNYASWKCDRTNWPSGETYWVACRVTSKTGKVSDWSEAVSFYIGSAPTCTIASTSLQTLTIEDDDGVTRQQLSLTELPLTATITGAGAGGTTTLIIERAEDYQMLRPDGSVRDGYEGETIAIFRQMGEAQITIDRGDLIGLLDDSASYRLIAMVDDGNGQSDTVVLPFEVHWDHQPEIPVVVVDVEDGVAIITAALSAGQEEGDGINIYRLSADSPRLIVENGEYGEPYVDPFPALGASGGYRIVGVSQYGDYITADNQPAWIDEPINLPHDVGYIHFNSETIPVEWNVELASAWEKDFKETKYLGGAVRGDWNPAVSRTASASITVPNDDIGTIQAYRRLADFAGICHIRTQDGSSYAADVQVSESTGYSSGGNLTVFSLAITRVDPEELDGLPYSEWVVEE